jgi:pullulanase/glycogen debranching enzyme
MLIAVDAEDVGNQYGPLSTLEERSLRPGVDSIKRQSVVADANFVWDNTGYQTPAFNQTVIYEGHGGSFLFDPPGAILG